MTISSLAQPFVTVRRSIADERFPQIPMKPTRAIPTPETPLATEENANGQESTPTPERSSAWTLPLLCAGIAILACCLIIPAADDNRRLVYERQKLSADLVQLEKQVDVNGQFLKSVSVDPALLERLAQRQMKMVRDGTSVLELSDARPQGDLSPYLLLSIPPPPPQAEYHPIGGRFAQLCRAPRSRLFIMGGALLAIACGLILGEAGTSDAAVD